LEEFRKPHPEDVNRLTVKPATHTYNDMERIMPGAVFLYKGKRYVSFGVQSNGARFTSPLLEKGYVPVKECQIICSNTGLVFLGVTIDKLNAARINLKETQKARKAVCVETKQKNETKENLENEEGGLADSEC
jgi:hypothetical protein